MALHNAPPVVYPLGRSRFQGLVLLGLWLAAGLLVMLWWLAAPKLDWRFALAAVVLLGAGWAARTGWENSPAGQLAWDGQVWHWESQGYQAGTAVLELSVLLDFQRILLLRLENQAHARLWLWAERASMPDRWLDLRRAVYSRPKASAASLLHDVMPAADLTTDTPRPHS